MKRTERFCTWEYLSKTFSLDFALQIKKKNKVFGEKMVPDEEKTVWGIQTFCRQEKAVFNESHQAEGINLELADCSDKTSFTVAEIQ